MKLFIRGLLQVLLLMSRTPTSRLLNLVDNFEQKSEASPTGRLPGSHDERTAMHLLCGHGKSWRFRFSNRHKGLFSRLIGHSYDPVDSRPHEVQLRSRLYLQALAFDMSVPAIEISSGLNVASSHILGCALSGGCQC